MNNNKFSLFPIGIIMIVGQLIVVFGNDNWNFFFSFASFEAFIYSLCYFIGSWFFGILGLVFVLISIFHTPKEREDNDDDWD